MAGPISFLVSLVVQALPGENDRGTPCRQDRDQHLSRDVNFDKQSLPSRM